MKTYTDYIRRWCTVAAAAALMVCNGCSDDFGRNMGNEYETGPSDYLVFATHLGPKTGTTGARSAAGCVEIAEEEWSLDMSPRDSIGSRGALTAYLSGDAGVIGYQTDDGGNKSFIGGDNILKFTFDGDMLVSAGASIPWGTITGPKLNIYAYAPYGLTDSVPGTVIATTESTTAQPVAPTIEYTVPAEIAKQQDIIAAKTDTAAKHKNEFISLEFGHILTAIRFKVGFDCYVKSVQITGVYNTGTYNFETKEWTLSDARKDYKIKTTEGLENHPGYVFFEKGDFLTGDGGSDDDYMILMPQTLPQDAKIILNCVDVETDESGNVLKEQDLPPYTANIGGTESEPKKWEPGRLITYTFYKDEVEVQKIIYFDLALGNVTINASSYSGKVFRNGQIETQSGTHVSGNHYYVYQSTEENRGGIWGGGLCTPPTYDRVKGPDGQLWSDFITNNDSVDQVIEAWDKNHLGVATDVNRKATEHWINIIGAVTCNLTIDNIFSTYQDSYPTNRKTAGITFVPTRSDKGVKNAVVTVNIVGDNRIGAVHYANNSTTDNGNQIVFEGTGTLTVADVDGIKRAGELDLDSEVGLDSGEGYWSNHWSSAIGGHDDSDEQISNGIVINSGIIFAGTTKAENCTAIGGGGNEYGKITINGGTVTAVATTTGTAIGGGIGYNSYGGVGNVLITGGNVYAYNHANKWKIPSSAIGGAGSKGNFGAKGDVNIEGGYVYAESALGTAIGGGSSYSKYGGDAIITISGGEVFAKTGSELSASIGGGTGCSSLQEATNSFKQDGGNATITIKGNPIIRTGSIGGGGTGNEKAKIGHARIDIYGGDIQGQFILSAGSEKKPEFTMRGGTIRNSDTDDKEYYHVKEDGGAVWLQYGDVTIEGGTIENCKAKRGGAIYIAGAEDSKATFTMSGGTIRNNEAVRANNSGSHKDTDTGDSVNDFEGSGGAIYLVDGEVVLTRGTISGNLAAGGHGGGIFIRRGDLTVDNFEISGNATEVRRTGGGANTGTYAGGNGGGVYVYSKKTDVTVNIISGKITGNTCDRRGGGLCVIQEQEEGNNYIEADINIGAKDAVTTSLVISGNHSLLQGGGLYARGTNAHIDINSGTIQDNTVSQYVHNPDVANDQGSVTLVGGDENVNVKHNVVTFDANYGDNPETSTQKIVTETNSVLNTPKFTRVGYVLKGWNSRPIGAGKSYADGQIMNISEDITLYAQWEFSGKQ